MRSIQFQAALALSSALGSQALPHPSPDDSDLGDIKGFTKVYPATSNCKGWKNDDEARKRWDDSLAGVIGDDFINANGVANWPQKMDMAIFDEPQNSWYCRDQNTECSIDKECTEFAIRGVEGAHYLYLSLQNAIGVLRSYRNEVAWGAISNSLDVHRITQTFRREASDAEPNTLVLAATVFGMLGGLSAASAPIAGTFGFLSGMLAFAGNANPPKAPKTENFEGKLATTVQQSFEMTDNRVNEIINTLIGVEGFDQKLIPVEMTKQSFDNSVINALAGGQWLTNDPGRDLKSTVKKSVHMMKQHLAWLMIRYGRKGFYYIDAGADKNKCGDGDDDRLNEFWDDAADGCIKLMEVLKHNREGGEFVYAPRDVQDKLFANDDEYNLDVKKTFRNAYDCWKDNDGKVGRVDVINTDWSEDSPIPKCWFGIPMVRGFVDNNGLGDMVRLDDPWQADTGKTAWWGGLSEDGLVMDD